MIKALLFLLLNLMQDPVKIEKVKILTFNDILCTSLFLDLASSAIASLTVNDHSQVYLIISR